MAKERIDASQTIIEAMSLVAENKVNETDIKILSVLSKEKITIGNLSKKVGIASVNIWKRLKHLSKMKLIKIPDQGRGKPKYPEIKRTTLVNLILRDVDTFERVIKQNGEKE